MLQLSQISVTFALTYGSDRFLLESAEARSRHPVTLTSKQANL